MANTGGEVAIRVPVLLRVWVIGFGTFWCGACAWVTLIRSRGPLTIVLGAVAILFAIVLGFRLVRTGVWAERSGRLTVRNAPRSRRLDRTDIADFTITKLAGEGSHQGTQIVALLRDGTMFPLTVTQRAPWRRRSRQEYDLARLRAWLTEA